MRTSEVTDENEAAVLRALASHSRDLLVLVRPDGVTEGQLTLGAVPLGHPPEQRYANRHIAEHVHPDDLAPVLALLEEVRAGTGIETAIRVRARHYDGSWRLLAVDVLDRRSDPLLRGIVIRAHVKDDDVDGGDHAPGTPRVADRDERFHSLAEVAPFGILSADRRGYVVYANDEATRLLAVPADHLCGDGWESIVAAEDRTEVAAAAGAVLTHSDRERVTFRAYVRGEARWITAVFIPLGEGADRTGWIATIDDVTDRRHAELRLAHQATHDTLTGLPNRMLIGDRLNQALARLDRDPRPLAVLYVDLDHFKPINDRLGHAVGDRVLAEMARRLQSTTRPADTVGRIGGDEFVVVCEDASQDDARRLAERVIAVLTEPLLIAGATVTVGASVGVTTTTDPRVEATALLGAADEAMYRSKRSGRGTATLAEVAGS